MYPYFRTGFLRVPALADEKMLYLPGNDTGGSIAVLRVAVMTTERNLLASYVVVIRQLVTAAL